MWWRPRWLICKCFNQMHRRLKVVLAVLVVLMCVSLFVFYYYQNCGELFVRLFILCARSISLKSDERLILHRTLAAVDALFNAYNISYFIAGGTLLGYVRRGAMIPFDDDVDLYLNRNDLPLVSRAFMEISMNSSERPHFFAPPMSKDIALLRYAETPTILKVSLQLPGCFIPPSTTWCFPMIDIILYVETQAIMRSQVNQMQRVRQYMEVVSGQLFYDDDVEPRKRVKLDHLDVWIPNKADAFLVYYEASRQQCITGRYSHKYEKSINCVRTIPCQCLEGRWHEIVNDL